MSKVRRGTADGADRHRRKQENIHARMVLPVLRPRVVRPNSTPSGAAACAFGTLWTDHFDPPIGSALGCLWCLSYHGEEQ